MNLNIGYAIFHGDLVLQPTIRPNKVASVKAYLSLFPEEEREDVERNCRKVEITEIPELPCSIDDSSDISVIIGC